MFPFRSVVVMRTTHVGVIQGESGLGRCRQALDVQAMLQDGFQAAVGQRIDVDGPVSYTHLDVYKRQVMCCDGNELPASEL